MRTVWDQGATADLRVHVDGAASNTAVTVLVHDPDGTTQQQTPTPNDDRTEWHTPVLLDQAGTWTAVATVTGGGAGVRRYQLRVRPTSPAESTGRVYATTGDLARHTRAAPPLDADRQLARASELVESLAMTAWYAVDGEGYPTHPATRRAFRDATCAQAAFMAAGYGSEHGPAQQHSQVSIGSVSLGAPAGGSGPGQVVVDGVSVAAGTLAALRRGGLGLNHPDVTG